MLGTCFQERELVCQANQAVKLLVIQYTVDYMQNILTEIKPHLFKSSLWSIIFNMQLEANNNNNNSSRGDTVQSMCVCVIHLCKHHSLDVCRLLELCMGQNLAHE